MNPTFANAIAALVPTGMLLFGSAVQFSRRRGVATLFQLIGAACLIAVVICPLVRGPRLVSPDALGS